MLLKKNNLTIPLIFAISVMTLISCEKDETKLPAPEMIYTNLMDKAVKHNEPATLIDLNQDGTKDILFAVLAVGDPLSPLDKWQFRVGSSIETRLAINNQEQIPMLNKDQLIPLQNFNGYNWFEASSIILMQKNISDDLPAFWSGSWINVNRKFIPLQVKKADKRYNGWIEISTDITQDKIILHKAAIAKEPGKETLAGH